MQWDNSLEWAKEADREDPLAAFREQFIIPHTAGKEQIYFLGNSLGLQPKSTAGYLQNILNQWAGYGVEAFFMGDDPWLNYHDHLQKPLAAITGALPHELVIMNQLTVNLHLMLVSFYRPQGKRNKILCEARAFPSDQYMFETHLKHYGFNPGEVLLEVQPRKGEYTIHTEDILAAIEANKDELALVLFSGINYYTGQVFNMKAITAAAQAAGAKAGFDLAHAAGNIELKLHDWNVDFACWCSYKYLNSGPGAIGGVYIHERWHNNESLPRFAGWWGYEKATRFNMEKGFKPIRNAEGWQLSTPSLLLYAAHRSALEIFASAGIEQLHAKRKKLSGYLRFLMEVLIAAQSAQWIKIITPAAEQERGCQLSLHMLSHGREIYDGLMQQGIIADWREPDVIRLAPVPLYNRFEEVWRFVEAVREESEKF